MTKSKIIKPLALIFIISYAIWFGGSVLSTASLFEILDAENGFVLFEKYTDSETFLLIKMQTLEAFYMSLAYAAALISGIAIFILNLDQIKRRGWLFMAAILFFLAAPFEIFTIYHNSLLGIEIFSRGTNHVSDVIRESYIVRNQNITVRTLSSLSFLANLTAIIFMVFQPLNMAEISNEQKEK